MTATAEAWDAWRIASCEESGGHAWRFLPGQDENLSLACSCCPHAETLHPDGGVITLPWGLTIPVVTGACGYCGEEFRRPVTGEQFPAYCRKAHADRAKEKRHKGTVRSGQKARRERREAREAAYLIAAPRLAAEAAAREAREAAPAVQCPHPEKLAFDTAEDAVGKAGRDSRKHARAYRAYECEAGHWHLTARYARAQFDPALR